MLLLLSREKVSEVRSLCTALAAAQDECVAREHAQYLTVQLRQRGHRVGHAAAIAQQLLHGARHRAPVRAEARHRGQQCVRERGGERQLRRRRRRADCTATDGHGRAQRTARGVRVGGGGCGGCGCLQSEGVRKDQAAERAQRAELRVPEAWKRKLWRAAEVKASC